MELDNKTTLHDLTDMKIRGDKISCTVVWDYHMAKIADRAGIHIVSVGDSVGVNVWGRTNPLDVTLEEMLIVSGAARRGVQRALVSCDFPFGPVQRGVRTAVDAALRLVMEGGVDLVKIDAASDYPEAVEAITRAGIPVFAQFGATPQTALRGAVTNVEEMVSAAIQLERAGASLLNITGVSEEAGTAVVAAVRIPVLGGLGGGPWLDGRIRMAHAAIGYAAEGLDREPHAYANVSRIAFDAMLAFRGDVEASRHLVSDPQRGL